MSARGQGQGKTCAAFRRLPRKAWRRVLQPRSIIVTTRAPTGPERSRNTRRVPVMCTQRGGPKICRGKSVPPWPSPPTENCSSEAPPAVGGPRGSLGTGEEEPRLGLRHLNWLPGALQEHRPGPLPRSTAAEVPHRYSPPSQARGPPWDSKKRGTARELVLHGEPGPYRAVR